MENFVEICGKFVGKNRVNAYSFVNERLFFQKRGHRLFNSLYYKELKLSTI